MTPKRVIFVRFSDLKILIELNESLATNKLQEYNWKLTPVTPRYQLSLLYLSSSNHTRLTHLRRLVTLPPPDV